MERFLILLLLLLGLAGVIGSDNLIKKVMGLTILDTAVIVLFVYSGSQTGTTAPILEPGVTDVVDPLPQALMLTAIVIGICLTALALTLIVHIARRYQTLSARRLQELLDRNHGP
jgi:multicomponent Na+:H+ antiporter subunit C